MKLGKTEILSKTWVFWGLMFLTLVLSINLLKDLKKMQSLLFSEWSRCRYLIYLLKNKTPLYQKIISPKKFEKELKNKGFEPEVVSTTASGAVEVKMKISWEKLGRLLSWMSSQNIKVETFHAESISDEGIFEVQMTVR